MSTSVNYARARRHLMRADPVLGAIVKRKGACGLAARSDESRFRSLLRALVSQQLSVKAAATIFSRVLALLPGDEACPRPEAILQLSPETLRGAGLSRQKASYLHDLSARVVAGTLRLDELDRLSDEEVMTALTAVKGVGRWTAEMILIFQLGRPDVLPVDDVGVLRSIQNVYGLRRRPSEEQVLRLGQRWRPYRSIASWYLWAALDNT
jgi:3-methyladenine DNA glycosylase/8-oxoguanine DNA glycosylase